MPWVLWFILWFPPLCSAKQWLLPSTYYRKRPDEPVMFFPQLTSGGQAFVHSAMISICIFHNLTMKLVLPFCQKCFFMFAVKTETFIFLILQPEVCKRHHEPGLCLQHPLNPLLATGNVAQYISLTYVWANVRRTNMFSSSKRKKLL